MKLNFRMALIASFLVTLANAPAFAQEANTEIPPRPLVSENEAGAVIISGNSESESYSAKTKNVITSQDNVYTIFGRYIRAKANGVESARAWDAGARYERKLSSYFGIFIGHKVESDPYAGFVQRDSSDLGGRYTLLKTADVNWITELGYRFSTTLQNTGVTERASFGRLYTEVTKAFSETSQLKYWAEYLPNMTDSNAYLANTELSLSVIITEILSLKLSYLVQYQNAPSTNGKRVDTTYTTALVAKF